MGKFAYKIVAGIIALVISLAFLPVIQDSIDGLTGTGMVYENTTTGALLDIIPTVLVFAIVAVAFLLTPATKE
jgi:uncharacterized RDD family membrane protein YckC